MGLKMFLRRKIKETSETNQVLFGKQRESNTLERFFSVLSDLAARYDLGTLERRLLRVVFVLNTSNKEVQTELCRSTKTPDEVYRIALSYEQGKNYPEKKSIN